MKSSFTAALYAVLIGGSPSAYGTAPKGKESSVPRTSYRPNTGAELQQFGEAWRLPIHQVVAVLVFLRSWLHNHLVLRNQPTSALTEGETEVLLAYARWLDGFPQVIRALPERVLLEEASIVKLKVPRFLPAALAPLVSDLTVEKPPRYSPDSARHASASRRAVVCSDQLPVRSDDRGFDCLKRSSSELPLTPRIGRSAAKTPRSGYSDRR